MAKSLNSAVSSAIRDTSSLEKFKKGKNLSSGVVFKDQKWIQLSQAFQDTLQIPGIPIGHITLLRGHSDTGKTTALLEASDSASLTFFVVIDGNKYTMSGCIPLWTF